MEYEQFMKLLKSRRTIRRFKPDPFPDEYIDKIIDASRYAMSGGNSQPWEFLVVKDPKIKEEIHKVYLDEFDMMYSLELQRIPRYRHPAFNVLPEEKDKARDMLSNFIDAPAIIVVLEDPRKMFGAALCARSDFETGSGSVLGVTMGHVEMVLSLAAASFGLGAGHVDILNHGPYKRILGIPDPVRLAVIVPIGYKAYEAGPPHRLPLEDLVHYEKYDMSKYMRNEDFLKYIDKIRALGRPGYRAAIGEGKA